MHKNSGLIICTVLLICLVNKLAFAQSSPLNSSLDIGSVQGSTVAGNVVSLPKLVSDVPSPRKKLNFLSVTKVRKAMNARFFAKGRSGTSLQPSRAHGSNLNMVPYAYGTYLTPYTTARVATGTDAASTNAADVPVSSYPYRAVGKLYFNIGTSLYTCSATLVKKGVILTAAHCVFDFGMNSKSGYFSNFVFCPAHNSATSPYGPYGCYPAGSPRVLSPYYKGTDSCYQSGVICNNDIATLLAPKITTGANKGKYLGTVYGTIAYSYNAYSFVENYLFNDGFSAQITQLGYPGAFDSGVQMQRTDSLSRAVTFVDDEGLETDNIIMGTAQTGGSSGGPWIVNFGTRPKVSSGSASLGSQSIAAIAGVSSWGYVDVGVNLQGASYFGQNSEFPNADYGTYGSGNIGKLMYDTCTVNSAYC